MAPVTFVESVRDVIRRMKREGVKPDVLIMSLDDWYLVEREIAERDFDATDGNHVIVLLGLTMFTSKVLAPGEFYVGTAELLSDDETIRPAIPRRFN